MVGKEWTCKNPWYFYTLTAIKKLKIVSFTIASKIKGEILKYKCNKISAGSESSMLQKKSKTYTRGETEHVYHVQGLEDFILLRCQFFPNGSITSVQFLLIFQEASKFLGCSFFLKKLSSLFFLYSLHFCKPQWWPVWVSPALGKVSVSEAKYTVFILFWRNIVSSDNKYLKVAETFVFRNFWVS